MRKTETRGIKLDNKLITDDTLEKISKLPINIVIEGETGTGKDKLALDIHNRSGRSGKFIAVNCAAIPEMIAESELFGVKSGAYTGATNSRYGFIEASHKGTLYLDELDSMPLPIQAKLLRAIEEQAVIPLGSTNVKYLDLRVITSTKIKIGKLLEDGILRGDLIYRLNTITLTLPNLKEIRNEIITNFNKFVTEFSIKFGTSPNDIDIDLIFRLENYSWPGNYRELRSCAEKFSIGIPVFEEENINTKQSLKQLTREYEKKIIKETITKNKGNLDIVSDDLNISKRCIYYKLSK
ncbi:sigma-54-dependent transcriptional regulator [Vibrio chagasii]|uniref:Sigma-54-dependent Fis family transcriptional regulator n=1 Tax=Vibrio chagasii TaxID=170679 RepID=A0A7Y3YU88_9VIBR|nr:sigma 54-interacting transcriptional regulator [Vibrio chagasii]NOH36555.1 sigma-54-dependent Fis family transcriptional regulator [Vibrio chagasii]